MRFLGRKRNGVIESRVKIADVYVITAKIISSYNDGSYCGPRHVTMYFLAKCKKREYYELFSGKKLEREKEPECGFVFEKFDTIYVTKVEPLSKYQINLNKKTTDIQSLFDFITNMNVVSSLGAFSEEEAEESKKS